MLVIAVLGMGFLAYERAKPRVDPGKQADAARMAAHMAARARAGRLDSAHAVPRADERSSHGPTTEWSGSARVVDGDTMQVQGADLHLWAIDAPEADQSCELDGKPWRCGHFATSELKNLIADRTVACVAEGDHSSSQERTALCFVRETRCAGTAACLTSLGSLNLAMIERGAAMDIEGHFMDAQADAREQRRGLWAGQSVPPWEWRGVEPGQ